MPNGVIGNTTDSGSVKSRFEPWLGNLSTKTLTLKINKLGFFYTPNSPCRVNHVSTDFEIRFSSWYKTPLTKYHR